MIELFVAYSVGTLTGMYIGYSGFRSYWMSKGASKLYDLLREKGRLIHYGD